jgi:hypothetical protein
LHLLEEPTHKIDNWKSSFSNQEHPPFFKDEWPFVRLHEPGADWEQKASVAIGFIKATETLQKKPHNHFKKASLKMYLKILEII